MRFADRLALSMGPLVLRVLLAGTFCWAGMGKVLTTSEVSPADAARLAEFGVTVVVNAPASPASDGTPTLEIPDPEPSESDAPTPSGDEPEQPEQATPLEEVSWGGFQPAQPEDYPQGGTVRTMYMVALMIDDAANPGLDDQSNPIKPIWPAPLASGPWPVLLAWALTIGEIGLGLMILVGLLTRFAALGIVTMMGTAAWLTVIGPAIQAGSPTLGFLPNHEVFDVGAWQTFAWQLSLLGAALAVFFMGSGSIGFDRALFRKSEPFPEPDPGTIPGAQDVEAPRGPFDRSVEGDQS